jgi:TrpR-related protein YerC/YecD
MKENTSMDYMDHQARERLVSAILSLQTPEECQAFLEDICTIRELSDISQRWEVAMMLSKGSNYAEISSETGASTATISRVNKCLMYGSGGYKRVLEKMEKEKGDD